MKKGVRKDYRCSAWWRGGSSVAGMGGALRVGSGVERGSGGRLLVLCLGGKDQFAVGGLVGGRHGWCCAWGRKDWCCAWWGGRAKTSSLEGGVVGGKPRGGKTAGALRGGARRRHLLKLGKPWGRKGERSGVIKTTSF